MADAVPLSSKQTIRELHRGDLWSSCLMPLVKYNLDTGAFLICSAVAVWLWYSPAWPLCIVVWLIGGHFGHTKPLSFHDAAHGTLNRVGWLNELKGHLTASIILVPLSVYRYAHSLHHARLSTPRDPELWPFTDTSKPRWFRVMCAFLEITFGFLYTPWLFFRSVLVAGKLPKGSRREFAFGYFMSFALWTVVLSIVTWLDAWPQFTIGYIVPVAVAGAYQTLNKYVEHLGLTGNTIMELTRTVVDRRQLGHLCSFSMQHVDYHGTHHRYAKIPFHNLPEATDVVYKQVGPERMPIYPSYWSATIDMIKTLGNPIAGPQWREGGARQMEDSEVEALSRNDD